MKNVVKEIENLDIIYGVFYNYHLCNNHRDYKNFLESDEQIKYEFLLKGVVKHTTESSIKPSRFSMDDKYLEETVVPPVNAWHWGIESFEILDWSVERGTNELEEISIRYNKYNFIKMEFILSTAKIIFIFNDYEIFTLFCKNKNYLCWFKIN